MTRTFSLIIGLAVAALVFAAPAAAVFPTVDGGDSGYGATAGSSVVSAPDFWNYDASGQKVTNTSPGVAPEDLPALFAGTSGASESSAQPTVVTAGSTSRDVPREGIGVAAGVALLLGLLLVTRHVRIRQLAH